MSIFQAYLQVLRRLLLNPLRPHRLSATHCKY
uniref:Uncharacterized protein n=1 Tax=Anguilla anguilla TaxID=7936 RepID=A0A0E9RKP2_ANGAN